ncbi:MAG: cupin domain-containing protein [Verrucomicrobia bacterium]|nr:MAG: cupin domain-containing protein [Verrucomicrobiota bacterium]
MDVKNIRDATDWFEVLQTSKRTQTAMMILKPGKSSGSEPEGHKNSDQVLLVLKGELEGEIANETITLQEGDVIVIPARTKHKFSNRSSADVVTFNTYSPPEY